MGRLVRKSPESLLGSDDTTDNFLIRYRDFEDKFGVIRLNDPSGAIPGYSNDVRDHQVWYSQWAWNSKWMGSNIEDEYDYNPLYQPYSGIYLLGYKVGTTNYVTPDRNKIIDVSRYINKIKIYHVITLLPSRFSAYPIPCTDRFGDPIAYHFTIWLGHKQYHSGSTYENPLISYQYYEGSTYGVSQNQLSTIKTSIGQSIATPVTGTSSSTPNNNIDTFSFGLISVRNSPAGHQPEGGSWQCRRRQRYVTEGKMYNCCQGNPTNWDCFQGENFSGTDRFTFTIPGDADDDTDSNSWWMYGICTTSAKLADNSYIELSGYECIAHITRPTLLYVGQENPWASSNQSYESLTGFGYYGTNSSTALNQIDYQDGLRYIYIFRAQFSRGFESSPSDNVPIVISGVHNNHKKIKINLYYSCTPPTSNVNCYKFRISFHYDIKYYTGSGYSHATGDYDFTTPRIDYPYGLSNTEIVIESHIWAYHKGSYPNTVTFSNVKYGVAIDIHGFNPSTPALYKTLTITGVNTSTPIETVGTTTLDVSFDFTSDANSCSCFVY